MPASPYIGRSRPRQSSPFVRASAAMAMALSLGGCASMGLPFGPDLTGVSPEVTGSTAVQPVKIAAVDQVEPSDWETIRRAVAGIPTDAGATSVEWSNPDTRSTGTIATYAAPTQDAGTLCRPFATTVSDARGVRRYRAEACQRTDGRWQLRGVAADDALLS